MEAVFGIAAQEPVTTIVRVGGYEDTESPCDIRAHLQVEVKVGVIRKMEAGTNGNTAKGSLQLLDSRRIKRQQDPGATATPIRNANYFARIRLAVHQRRIVNAR